MHDLFFDAVTASRAGGLVEGKPRRTAALTRIRTSCYAARPASQSRHDEASTGLIRRFLTHYGGPTAGAADQAVPDD